eukprot:scaffold62468_cov45-Attheya_sp.AAC.8
MRHYLSQKQIPVQRWRESTALTNRHLSCSLMMVGHGSSAAATPFLLCHCFPLSRYSKSKRWQLELELGKVHHFLTRFVTMTS